MNKKTKFIINKYKNKTFEEVRKIILTKDLKYYSFLQRLYLKDNFDEDKKKNLDDFLKYWDYEENKTEEEIVETANEEEENIEEEIVEQKKQEENFEEVKLIEDDENKIIKKVYHISDIHIRLYQRFEEYENVFNELYSFLKKEKENNENSVIVITGDILHSKITLSPECILLTHSFFKNCASIFPTLIIAGNHDALLTNNQRIDAITPIIENSSIENLYYLKYSGIYRYGNICFGVSSLLDGKWVYGNKIIKDTNDISIALYHGGVGEFETGVGFRMKGEKLISDFDGYDYVMLGDIHKFQFLDEKKERIAYASSLITQNFNEWNTDHGVLRWDLENNNHSYFPIKNNNMFLVLDIDEEKIFYKNEEIESIDGMFKNIVKSLSLKLNIKNASPIFVKKIISDIQKIVKDVKIQYNFVKEDNEKIENDIELKIDSLDDWLIYYLENIKKIKDKKIIADILKEFKNYSEEITIQRDKSLNKWILIDLYFSNMFGYGESNYIDFTRFYDNSLIGILAPNSYGKSTIIDIILFILFGKFSRNSGLGISKDIINVNENTFECRLKFKIGNDTYVIEKKGRREKSGKIKITEEEFFRIDGSEKKILTDESRIKTDKIISDYIGSIDEFVFTNIQLQNRERSFKDMTNKERKEFLFKILKLDIFEKVNKLLNGDLRKAKQEYDYYKKIIEKVDKKSIDDRKKKLNELLDDIQKEMKGYENDKNEIDEKNNELYSSLKSVEEKYKIEDIENKREEYEEMKENQKEKEEIISSIICKINKYKGEINNLDCIKNENIIEKNYKKILEENQKEIEDINNKILDTKCLIKNTTDINSVLKNIVGGCKIDFNFFKEKKKYFMEKEKELNRKIDEYKENKNILDEKIENENTNFESMERYYQNEIKILQKRIVKNTDEKWKFDNDTQLLLKENIEIKKETLLTLENKKKTIIEELEKTNKSMLEEEELKKKLEKRLTRKNKLEKKIKILEKEKEELEKIDKIILQIEYNKNIINNFSELRFEESCNSCKSNKYRCEEIKKDYFEKIANYNIELEDLKKNITYNRDEEKEIRDRYENVKNIETDILKNQNKIHILNNKISEHNFSLKNIENEHQNIVNKINKYDKNKQRYNENVILEKEIKDCEDKIVENERKICENKEEKARLLEEQNKILCGLKKVEEEKKEVLNNLDILREGKEIYKENKKIKENNIELESKIREYELEKNKKQDVYYEEYDILQDQKIKEKELRQKININEKKQIEEEKNLFYIEKSIIEIKDLIDGYSVNFDNIKLNIKINEEIEKNNINRKKIENLVTELSEKNGELTQENNQLVDKINEYEENIIIFKDKENEYKQLQILDNALGRDGIPLLMLEKYLPLIETNINNIIYPFIQRKIVLSLENDNIIFESYIENTEKSVMIHGGMEAFILDLAFKITLSKYAMLPKCDILFIDEGISAFDKERLNSIDILFQFLKVNFNKIILITHIDQVKDEINSKIEIYKKDNKSQIKCCYSF